MNRLINKVGAVYNLCLNVVLDFILAGNSSDQRKTISSKNKDHAACQSINYSLLIESLKHVDFNKDDNVIDVGSGFGRVLIYLRWKYGIRNLAGYEVNKQAVEICKKNIKYKDIKIYNKDILDEKLTNAKYILFNPFNDKVLSELLTKNIGVEGYTLIFINAYEDHVKVFRESEFRELDIKTIHTLVKGIENKKLVIAKY